MAHHHRLLRKGGEEVLQTKRADDCSNCMDHDFGVKKTKPRPCRLLFLFSFVFLTFVVGHRLHFASSSPSLRFFDSIGTEKSRSPCSSLEDNAICCDRVTSFRTDVCFIRGDIRTHSSSSSIFLYRTINDGNENKTTEVVVEKIRPYTRKWEQPIMDTIGELNLVTSTGKPDHVCDVFHDAPAVFFSTGGYTGNVYHEFNDGIIPLYITAQGFHRNVVFVLLEYRKWWIAKYGDVLSQLSHHLAVDFSRDNRTHCFPEAIVGLRIHDELAIDSTKMRDGKGVLDFRELLDNAYRARIRSIELEEASNGEGNLMGLGMEPSAVARPKLVILSRNGSRAIENEEELVELCKDIGFQVQVLRPDRTTELAKIYRALNDSDVMIGVHGAAMTHLLFLRPGSVFIQIVPLGTDWAAESYYGQPAEKMGLKYVEYRILARESSLYLRYDEDDPVLLDPKSVTAKGWNMTKEVYLEGQNVKLDLNRFRNVLTSAYQYTVKMQNQSKFLWTWSWHLFT